MLEGGRIGSRQAVYFNITMVIATAWLSAPAIAASHAKQDAWLSVLPATVIGLCIAWITSQLGSLYPGKTLIQYVEDILGYWLGRVMGLLYILWFINVSSVIVREYGTFLVDVFMPATPLVVFNIMVVSVAAYTVYMGLEVLARTNQFFLPINVVSILLIFLLAIPKMSFSNILPFFESGVIDIFKGSLSPLDWIGQIFVFSMIIPFLAKPKDSLKIAVYSVIFLGFNLLLLILGSLLTFGANLENMNYPVLSVGRVIGAVGFQRVDPLIISIWVIGGLLKVAIYYYVLVLSFSQWCGLKDYRPVVLPLGVIVVAFSMAISANTLELGAFLTDVWPFYVLLTFEFGFPLMLLLIAKIRVKR